MSTDEQLAWERRAGKYAAAAAFGYLLLVVAGSIYLQVALEDPPGDQTERFVSFDLHPGAHLAAVAIQAAGLALLAVVLGYLDRATAARVSRRKIVAFLAIGAPIALAITQIAQQLELNDLARNFVPGSEPKADRLVDDVSPVVLEAGRAAALALSAAFIFVSRYAVRAGLLSRFMGILGIVLGALNALIAVLLGGGSALGPIQLFWIGALGVLFLGRWPGGRGPAWQTGEAIPWPGAAEQRAELERRRAEEEPDDEEPEPRAPRPASRKRKKKRG